MIETIETYHAGGGLVNLKRLVNTLQKQGFEVNSGEQLEVRDSNTLVGRINHHTHYHPGAKILTHITELNIYVFMEEAQRLRNFAQHYQVPKKR